MQSPPPSGNEGEGLPEDVANISYNTSHTEVSDGGKNMPTCTLIRNNDKQVPLLQMQI